MLLLLLMLLGGDLHALHVGPGQNVETAVTFGLQIRGAVEGSGVSVLIVLLEVLAALV